MRRLDPSLEPLAHVELTEKPGPGRNCARAKDAGEWPFVIFNCAAFRGQRACWTNTASISTTPFIRRSNRGNAKHFAFHVQVRFSTSAGFLR
jgi:hypothetical protein